MSHRKRGLELEGHIIHLVSDTASIKAAYHALVFCSHSMSSAHEDEVCWKGDYAMHNIHKAEVPTLGWARMKLTQRIV